MRDVREHPAWPLDQRIRPRRISDSVCLLSLPTAICQLRSRHARLSSRAWTHRRCRSHSATARTPQHPKRGRRADLAQPQLADGARIRKLCACYTAIQPGPLCCNAQREKHKFTSILQSYSIWLHRTSRSPVHPMRGRVVMLYDCRIKEPAFGRLCFSPTLASLLHAPFVCMSD